MGVDKEKVAVSAIRRLKIRRGRYAESGPGILEVQHQHDRDDGDQSWSFVIRDRDGKSKGGFVLYQAEAILLADIITETRQESVDSWDVPS
jgi:hypothetical protein